MLCRHRLDPEVGQHSVNPCLLRGPGWISTVDAHSSRLKQPLGSETSACQRRMGAYRSRDSKRASARALAGIPRFDAPDCDNGGGGEIESPPPVNQRSSQDGQPAS
jgi:hypothetical protein